VQQVLFGHSVLLQVLLKTVLWVDEAVAVHALAEARLDRCTSSSSVIVQASHTWQLIRFSQVSDLLIGLINTVLGLVLRLYAAIRGKSSIFAVAARLRNLITLLHNHV
jgi:hypothetical protein